MSANDFIDDIPSGCLFADPATLPGDYKPAKRVFLRQVMRYRFVYATYPRAYEDAPIQFNKNCGQTFLIAWTLKINIYKSFEEIYVSQGNKQVSILY